MPRRGLTHQQSYYSGPRFKESDALIARFRSIGLDPLYRTMLSTNRFFRRKSGFKPQSLLASKQKLRSQLHQVAAWHAKSSH